MKAPWNLLGQNLLLAIQTFRVQQALLHIITTAGPVTTRELVGWSKYRLPAVTPKTLQRRLTQLRKARALRVYRISGDPADGVFWAIPGQPKPTDVATRRRKVQSVIIDRRAVAPRESWWVQASREAFKDALEQRWQS